MNDFKSFGLGGLQESVIKLLEVIQKNSSNLIPEDLKRELDQFDYHSLPNMAPYEFKELKWIKAGLRMEFKCGRYIMIRKFTRRVRGGQIVMISKKYKRKKLNIN
jgi:hypothetical protein